MKVFAVEYNPNFDGSSVWSVQSLHTTKEGAERAMLISRLTPITLDEVLAARSRPPKDFSLRKFLRHMRELRKDGKWDREFTWFRHWWFQATPEEYSRGFPAALYRTILRKLVERRRRSFYESQSKREHIPYSRFARSPEDGKLHLLNGLTPGEDLRVTEWMVK